MAVVQIHDLDDRLYEALKTLAIKEKRSISEEIAFMIEAYLNFPKTSHVQATEEFLTLTWTGDESSEEIVTDIHRERKNSSRFESRHDLFD